MFQFFFLLDFVFFDDVVHTILFVSSMSPLNLPRTTWQLQSRESLEEWSKFGERTPKEVNFLTLLEDISQRRSRAQRLGL
jgi:hypothetical protein